MNNKEQLLTSVLKIYGTNPLKVIDIRNHVLEENPECNLDPGDLRRYINGKCHSYEKKGWLVKTETDKKTYFQVTTIFTKKFGTYEQPVTIEKKIVAKRTNLESSNQQEIESLKSDLEKTRKEALIQLGEIKEYQRIRDSYPKVGLIATQKFEEMIDQNHRLLGKIKALESVIGEQ